MEGNTIGAEQNLNKSYGCNATAATGVMIYATICECVLDPFQKNRSHKAPLSAVKGKDSDQSKVNNRSQPRELFGKQNQTLIKPRK